MHSYCPSAKSKWSLEGRRTVDANMRLQKAETGRAPTKYAVDKELSIREAKTLLDAAGAPEEIKQW